MPTPVRAALDLPLGPSVSIGDVDQPEGNSDHTPFVFSVTLSEAATVPLTVSYTTVDGTASSGTDYEATAGSVTFGVGEQRKTITVPVVADRIDEPDESFSVRLSLDPPALGSLGDDEAMATARNDDGGILSVGDITIDRPRQGSADVSFPVTLDAAHSFPVSVEYATADGTAVAGSDYEPAAGTLHFEAGETAKVVPVTVHGSVGVEPDEAFTLGLSNPTDTALGRSRGTATIVAPHVDTVVSVADAETDEGDSGVTPLEFAVTLSTPAGVPVTVDYTTADGDAAPPSCYWCPADENATAADGDYEPVSGTLTFAPGEMALTASVPVHGDTTVEKNEQVRLLLSDPSDGAALGRAAAVGRVLNDDGAVVRIEDAPPVVRGTTSYFRVVLNRPQDQPVAVNYTADTDKGTASYGTNPDNDWWIPDASQFTFEPGETEHLIAATTSGPDSETDESFYVAILEGWCKTCVTPTFRRSEAQGTILGLPSLSFRPCEPCGAGFVVAGKEGGSGQDTPFPFVVRLSRPSNAAVTVDYATVDDTATAVFDYQPTSGTLTFPPGITEQTVNVNVHGDERFEQAERFLLHLANPEGASVSSEQADGAARIDDDDLPSLSTVTDPGGQLPGGGDVPPADTEHAGDTAGFGRGVQTHEGAGRVVVSGHDTDAHAAPDPQLQLASDAVHFLHRLVSYVTFEVAEPRLLLVARRTSGSESYPGRTVGSPNPPEAGLRGSFQAHPGGRDPVTGQPDPPPPFDPAKGYQPGCPQAPQRPAGTHGCYDRAAGPGEFADPTAPSPAKDLRTVDFSEYDAVVIASSPSWQMTGAEVGILHDRAGDIGRYIAAGGGMLTFSGAQLDNPDWLSWLPCVRESARDNPGEAEDTLTPAGYAMGLLPADVTGAWSHGAFAVNTAAQPCGMDIVDAMGAGAVPITLATPPPVPAPTICASDASLAEGHDGTTRMQFTVTLANPLDGQQVSVEYATADGTATTAGSDYRAAKGKVTFAPGENQATIEVEVNGDTSVEPDEQFYLSLSNPTAAFFAGAGCDTAQGLIRNDDASPAGDNPQDSDKGAGPPDGSKQGSTDPVSPAQPVTSPSPAAHPAAQLQPQILSVSPAPQAQLQPGISLQPNPVANTQVQLQPHPAPGGQVQSASQPHPSAQAHPAAQSQTSVQGAPSVQPAGQAQLQGGASPAAAPPGHAQAGAAAEPVPESRLQPEVERARERPYLASRRPSSSLPPAAGGVAAGVLTAAAAALAARRGPAQPSTLRLPAGTRRRRRRRPR